MKPDAKLSAIRSRAYEYAVHNASGLLLGGRITFVFPANVAEATQRAIEESAVTAETMGVPFDPFNLSAVVKPLKTNTPATAL